MQTARGFPVPSFHRCNAMLRKSVKNRIKSEEGQAMVEFAIALPLLLLILCGIIDFGWLFYNQLNVDNTSREAARAICVQCSNTPYNDVYDTAEEIINANIYNPETLREVDGITVAYLDASGNQIENSNGVNAKMVRVTVRIDMPVLTFVLHAICQGDTRTVSSSSTFKVEAGTVQEVTEP